MFYSIEIVNLVFNLWSIFNRVRILLHFGVLQLITQRCCSGILDSIPKIGDSEPGIRSFPSLFNSIEGAYHLTHCFSRICSLDCLCCLCTLILLVSVCVCVCVPLHLQIRPVKNTHRCCHHTGLFGTSTCLIFSRF